MAILFVTIFAIVTAFDHHTGEDGHVGMFGGTCKAQPCTDDPNEPTEGDVLNPEYDWPWYGLNYWHMNLLLIPPRNKICYLSVYPDMDFISYFLQVENDKTD